MLQVYSTLSRKKEAFPKQPGERVTMYVCGPTVYKPSHIGHMVGPVIFDTIKRYLTYLGYKVDWVVNITDVDDKLILRANELKTTVPELATRMTNDYFDCLKKLNVTGVDHFPKATEHIDGMIGMMTRLIKSGYAYASDGDVYFNVAADEDYGKLCNRDPEQLEAGSRIEVSDRKRNPGDFALWKGAKPDEPPEVQFDSPWGKGRPGWHIECSAMAKALLGETIDIHGGGLDLKFPHHENELAQSESYSGREFAKIWMHNGLLRLRDKEGKVAKMAGSIGNVWNIADALKVVSGDLLRFFILNTHYRSPIDMGDWEGPKTQPIPPNVEAAKAAFDKFVQFAERVQRIAGKALSEIPIPDRKTFRSETHTAFDRRFHDLMDDDFNTGGAVGVLFELVTAANKHADQHKLEDPGTKNESALAEFLEAAGLVRLITEILGLKLESQKAELGGGSELVSGLMQLLIDLRGNLRTEAKSAAKDNPLKKSLFDQTDLIRKRLGDLGITLEDRPGGTTWRAGS